MDLIKKSILALVLLLVVVLAWVGSSVYFQKFSIEVKPGVEGYTKSLKDSFDTEVVDMVVKRSEEAFPVSPDEFLSLTEEN
jgi:hypothetical protein